MRNYEFKLTPAYCLYNGIAIKKQQGSRICFLSENPDNEQLRLRVTKAFKNYLEYVNRQEDCPEIFRNRPYVQFVAGNHSELRKQVSHLYSQDGIIADSMEARTEDLQDKKENQKKESETAAVLLLDTIMTDARKNNATDIHIENNCVRFRILGKLQTVTTLTEDICIELIQRIKFLAGMNVLEKRRSQEGHFVYGGMDPIFVRVSTVGVVCGKTSGSGESVVIRLLDTRRLPLTIDKLGFNKPQLERIKKMSEVPNGLIIICGPTGAGKSTTAAALLVELETNGNNSTKIISLEDPPEYLIPGITQIQIDEKNGNSFSDSLMHIFRQDPDVLMIGEIRDESSASVAIRAALTGHLVIATLHASSAAGVILRLENLGIPRNLIISVLKGVIVQELNNFEGHVNLVADVAEPSEMLIKNADKQLTEQEYENYFEHITNYKLVLEKTIGVLKEKHMMNTNSNEEISEENIEKQEVRSSIKTGKKPVFLPAKNKSKKEEAAV